MPAAVVLTLPIKVTPPVSALLIVLLAVNAMMSLVETVVAVPVILNVPPLRVIMLPPTPRLLAIAELLLMVATAKVPALIAVPPV